MAVFAISALSLLPFVNAFTFGSQYGAFSSAAAASDYYGIYDSGNSTNSHAQGDGIPTASASEATGTDSAGGSASSSSAVNAVTHTLSGSGTADCTGSNDCYDTYYGGYSGLGGGGAATMYDTYTFTCASCSYIDVSISYTETGSFGALDNGPVCQGTAVPETLSAVACESVVEPRILVGNTAYCAGKQSIGCPANVIDYQQGWNFCQGGGDVLFYCPSSTSFSLSGTVDLSQIMQSEGVPFTSAYVAPGGSMQLQFQLTVDSNVDLPGSESASGSTTFSVTSGTPGVTITSSACGCSTTSPPAASTTTVQVTPASVPVGTPTPVKAIVSGTSPTGTVTWSSSGSGTFSSNTCTLSSTECSVNYTPTSTVGSPQTITASYGGDSANLPSSGTGSLRVSQASTSTAVNCLPGTVGTGSPSMCTATVSGGSSPGGTVTFSSNSGTGSFSPSNFCALSSGSCSVSYSDSATGSPTITAVYGGDASDFGSTGYGSVNIAGASSTGVSCSPPSVATGTPTECTATVTGDSPTGSVGWSSSSGTGVFSTSTCTLSSGSCSVSYSDSTSGAPVITATYAGDSNNGGSAGSTILANFQNSIASSISSGMTNVSGAACVDQARTGVDTCVSGSSGDANFQVESSDLSSQPSGTPTLSLSNGQYFDVEISGLSGGTANICITGNVASTTQFEYYSGESWIAATTTSLTVGNPGQICANIPVSALVGTPIALGSSPTGPAPTGVPEFPWSSLLTLMVVLPLILALRQRRAS